mmetsp:Transcript_85141/g.214695  ORF Transcript_85141/g.214695 Transcript_85141/m.214695 type:complete len:204 (+) Transcript_85141:239-850(+)
MNSMRPRSWPICAKVNSSTMHHILLKYVLPARTTIVEQPLTKMGRHCKSTSMLVWSMQHLSIQTCGSRPCCNTKEERQCCRAFHLAAASSCQEWETKASHELRVDKRAGWESEYRAGFGWLSARSSAVREERSMTLNRALAEAKTPSAVPSPTRPAIPAAASLYARASKRRIKMVCIFLRKFGLHAMYMITRRGIELIHHGSW